MYVQKSVAVNRVIYTQQMLHTRAVNGNQNDLVIGILSIYSLIPGDCRLYIQPLISSQSPLTSFNMFLFLVTYSLLEMTFYCDQRGRKLHKINS